MSSGPNPAFSAAVLAGGRSTRMGVDKAFLRVGGELLLDRQLRIAREAGAAELLISGRREVDYSGFNAGVIHDRQPDAGPLAGIASILEVASHPIVLVLAVDMPEMTASILRNLIANCHENSGCVPFDQDGFQPLAAVYPHTALLLALQELRAGNLSMQAFVQKAIDKNMVRPLKITPSEQIHFVNWNQPEDWANRSV
jgi:molybdopterin-guanine dinucleotide biosynthesis protein A